MSKGSGRRPASVSEAELAERWSSTFEGGPRRVQRDAARAQVGHDPIEAQAGSVAEGSGAAVEA